MLFLSLMTNLSFIDQQLIQTFEIYLISYTCFVVLEDVFQYSQLTGVCKLFSMQGMLFSSFQRHLLAFFVAAKILLFHISVLCWSLRCCVGNIVYLYISAFYYYCYQTCHSLSCNVTVSFVGIYLFSSMSETSMNQGSCCFEFYESQH